MKIIAIHEKADYPFFSPDFSRGKVDKNYYRIVSDLYKNSTSRRNQYQYSDVAEQLLAAEKSDAIKIDHLAFSFKLAELRHCAKAGHAQNLREVTTEKESFFTKQKVKTKKQIKVAPKYPTLTKIQTFEESGFSTFDDYKNDIETQLIEFYIRTLNIWVHDVLKLELGSLRGKGFHGYSDSMELKANGVSVGFVGIGGQQNTCYFQISGTGCKYLFSNVKPFILHHWLAKVLNVSNLGRVDLCYDDFDDNFNCNYAETAYMDGAFRVSTRGQYPTISPQNKYTIDSEKNKIYSQEMIVIGSRSSQIYWRIYNKKLEQGINKDDFVWYRSEVELKKWSVDVLLNPAAAFTGLCAFSASLDMTKGVRTKAMTKAKEACIDLAARVRHVRRSAGRALGDILEVFEGDIEKTLGLILPDDTGGKLGLPPIYQQLIKVIEVQNV